MKRKHRKTGFYLSILCAVFCTSVYAAPAVPGLTPGSSSSSSTTTVAPGTLSIPQYNYPQAPKYLNTILNNITWYTTGTNNINLGSIESGNIIQFNSMIFDSVANTMDNSGSRTGYALAPFSTVSTLPTKGSFITSQLTGFYRVEVYNEQVNYEDPAFPVKDAKDPTYYFIPIGTTYVQNTGKNLCNFNFYTKLSFYSEADPSSGPGAVYCVKNGVIPGIFNGADLSPDNIQWNAQYTTTQINNNTFPPNNSSSSSSGQNIINNSSPLPGLNIINNSSSGVSNTPIVELDSTTNNYVPNNYTQEFTWNVNPIEGINETLIEAYPYVRIEHVIDFTKGVVSGPFDAPTYNLQDLHTRYMIDVICALANFVATPIISATNKGSAPIPTPWGKTGSSGSLSSTQTTQAADPTMGTSGSYYAQLYDAFSSLKAANNFFLPYVTSGNLPTWAGSLSFSNVLTYYIMLDVYKIIQESTVELPAIFTTKLKADDTNLWIKIINGLQYINAYIYQNVKNLDQKAVMNLWYGMYLFNKKIQNTYYCFPTNGWAAFSKIIGKIYDAAGTTEKWNAAIQCLGNLTLNSALVFFYPAFDPQTLHNKTTPLSYEDVLEIPCPQSPGALVATDSTAQPFYDYYQIVAQWYEYGLLAFAQISPELLDSTTTDQGTTTSVIKPDITNLNYIRNILLTIAYIVVDSNCKYNTACNIMYGTCLLFFTDVTSNLTEAAIESFTEVIKNNKELCQKYNNQMGNIITNLGNYLGTDYSSQIKELQNALSQTSGTGAASPNEQKGDI